MKNDISFFTCISAPLFNIKPTWLISAIFYTIFFIMRDKKKICYAEKNIMLFYWFLVLAFPFIFDPLLVVVVVVISPSTASIPFSNLNGFAYFHVEK